MDTAILAFWRLSTATSLSLTFFFRILIWHSKNHLWNGNRWVWVNWFQQIL
jgi:hypothetical protein